MPVISEENLENLLDTIDKDYSVFAPVKTDDKTRFQEINDSTDLNLCYSSSVMSPKKFFLPDGETLYSVEDGDLTSFKQKRDEFVVFGLNRFDLEALERLDTALNRGEPDQPYFKRRDASIVIGVVNQRIETSAADLILYRKSGSYEATAETQKGEQLLENDLFKQGSLEIPESGSGFPENPGILKNAVEWSWEGYPEIWEELGDRCIGCGICSYVCPLCFCFSMEDRENLEQNISERKRNWSSCMLPCFSRVTSGHNPNEQLKNRIYHWYLHKFVRGPKEGGSPLCVGCGRCHENCPADIDIRKVTSRIIEKYREEVLEA